MNPPVDVELPACSSRHHYGMSRRIVDGTPFLFGAASRVGLAPSEGRFPVLILTEQGTAPLVVSRLVAVMTNYLVEVGLGLSHHGSAAASYHVVVGVPS